MSRPKSISPRPEPGFQPALVVLFAGSGCAALIYEVTWFQMLQLVVGSTAVSIGALLASFMGGMCIGSLGWPRIVSPGRHPLRIFAFLELGTAVAGLLVLLLLPSAGHLYASIGGSGFTGMSLRGLLCALFLLPPTVMMGATLPVMARWIETTPRGVSWLGFFYGGNTAGAVVGCVLAGFYLLRLHDVAVATYWAAGINALVALAALGLAKVARYEPAEREISPSTGASGGGAIRTAIALSGFCALGAEVVWNRSASLLLGGTVYTFSIILAVFLSGLGLGGITGSILARGPGNPRLLLGLAQILQVPAIGWAAALLHAVLPAWPIDPFLGSPLANLQVDIVRAALAILPSTLLWGASFPLALASLAQPGQDPGRLAGATYAANTLGAIAGATMAALVFLPQFGTQHTQQILIGLTLASGAIALLSANRDTARPDSKASAGILVVFTGSLVAIAAISLVPTVPWRLVAFGRQVAVAPPPGMKSRYVGEGMNSSIAVAEAINGILSFHVAGKIEASNMPEDMRLQRMLGHIPALFHPAPRSVLVVGFGSGVTAGSFAAYPSVQRIVICEIEPLIPEKIGPFFTAENRDIANDPRVEIVYDDARHYILTTNERFDVITSDPIHPWVKGAASLYTVEYFELCKQRLNPGGIVSQWVPFYQSNAAVVRSEIATFLDVFPEGTIWGNAHEGTGYDVVMLGQAGPFHLNVSAIEERLQRPDYREVAQSLTESGFPSAAALIATYVGRQRYLTDWLGDAEINRDRNLRLQYLAGLQIDSTAGQAAYRPMVSNRQFPDDLFEGSPESLADVARLLEPVRPGRR